MTDADLNVAVAERVMVWTRDGTNIFGQIVYVGGTRPMADLPFLDDDWYGVRIVVERMRELGWRVLIEVREDGVFEVEFWSKSRTDIPIATSDTFPRAVCLAALKAVGGEVK